MLAPAKVNLTLEVLGRRRDGFHEIRTVMQAITLADRLWLAPAATLTLACNRPELETPDNLVWKAAEALQRATGAAVGASITLEKHIPVAAGLGGGSADAAAALLGLNALWNTALPRARLRELAVGLGSDVPFFLGNSGTALAEGRGERLTALPHLPQRWVVLVKPQCGISAGAVYGAFPPSGWSDGTRTAIWIAGAARLGHDARVDGTPEVVGPPGMVGPPEIGGPPGPPSPPGMADSPGAASAAGAVGVELPPPFNALEAVALQVEPRAAAARDALVVSGARRPLMSGSGSTYFALFDDGAAAGRVCRHLQGQGAEAYLARFSPQTAHLEDA